MFTRSPFVQVASATSKLALLFVLTTAFATGTVINSTSVTGNWLRITGTGFSGAPTVIFNGAKVGIDNSTETQIVATLNPVPAPGIYRVIVKTGATSAVSYVEISRRPRIAAQVALTGQTAPIPITTLLTPRNDGLYRVSAYLASAFPVDDGNVNFQVGWTDENGSEQCPDLGNGTPCIALFGNMHPSDHNDIVFMVRALAGTPITYSTSEIINPNGPPIYELFITVEQLQ